MPDHLPNPIVPKRKFLAVTAAAVGVMALLRYRGRYGIYRGIHRWLAEHGTADWIRGLDNDVLLVLFGIVLWALLRRLGDASSGGLLSDIGLSRGITRGLGIGLLILTPMLLLGACIGTVRLELPMLRLAGLSPFAEEWFFRGVLVLACTRLVAARFWTAAVLSALLFGLGHVSWTLQGLATGWPRLLVTTAGGIWYAWLARQWGRNLYLAMVLHMGMNLSWSWYPASGSAAWPEIGRGGTIALGTLLTLFPGRFREAPPAPQPSRPTEPPAH